MKEKTVKSITVCIIMMAIFSTLSSFNAYAFDYDNDEYGSMLSGYDTSFVEELDDESREVLDALGLLDFDYSKIINLSMSDLINIFKDLFIQKLQNPLKSVALVFIILCLSSFFQGIKEASQEGEMASLFSSVSAIVIALILLAEIKETIAVSAASISVCADFIFAFVPAFLIIVAASGNTLAAVTSNGMLLALGQAVNYISKNLFLPVSNCILALSIASGIRSDSNLYALIQTLKKYITTAISLCATGFVSVLSIKTVVAAKADVIGIRSIRFAINSVVPVIGGAISEGLLSIQAYSSLVKSSVGIVGIIAVAAIFLPSIISVSIWRLFLSLCSAVSDVFNDGSVKCILDAFINALLIMNVLLLLTMTTTIISIGILIAAKGSA